MKVENVSKQFPKHFHLSTEQIQSGEGKLCCKHRALGLLGLCLKGSSKAVPAEPSPCLGCKHPHGNRDGIRQMRRSRNPSKTEPRNKLGQDRKQLLLQLPILSSTRFLLCFEQMKSSPARVILGYYPSPGPEDDAVTHLDRGQDRTELAELSFTTKPSPAPRSAEV